MLENVQNEMEEMLGRVRIFWMSQAMSGAQLS